MDKPINISPIPTVDPDLDIHDYNAVNNAKKEFFKEQQVRSQEIKIIRDKLAWCHRREGVNHLQNCRVLAQQYMDLLDSFKGGDVKPFKLPPPPSKE